MRRVGLEDLAGPSRYGEMRDEFRRRIIALKRDRRVAVGDRVTLVFENFDTVLFQTQEMLHAERITDLDQALQTLGLQSPNRAGRPWAERRRGALKLLRKQAWLLGAQALLTLGVILASPWLPFAG